MNQQQSNSEDIKIQKVVAVKKNGFILELQIPPPDIIAQSMSSHNKSSFNNSLQNQNTNQHILGNSQNNSPTHTKDLNDYTDISGNQNNSQDNKSTELNSISHKSKLEQFKNLFQR